MTRMMAFAFLATLAACSGDKDAGDDVTGDTDDTDATADLGTEDVLALTGDDVAGDSVFQANCTTCHGATGTEGPTGPDLSTLVPSMTDEEIVMAILNGPGTMPAFTLPQQDVADVTEWLRVSFP